VAKYSTDVVLGAVENIFRKEGQDKKAAAVRNLRTSRREAKATEVCPC